MNTADDLVLQALRNPAQVVSLGLPDWDRLLRRARNAGVLARLAVQLADLGVDESLPLQVRDHLAAARPVSTQHARVIRWEVNRIRRALQDTGTGIVLLKGAAYCMAGLPPSRGRLISDVDVMVSKPSLGRVEQALLAAGWETMKLDPYDQRYYRTWSHELPPLMHRQRKSIVDVHHTILPASGRLHPDPTKLLEAARPIDGDDLLVLGPEDMVLHSAAHLFQDGDLAGGLRDIVDLHDLLGHFGAAEPGFWTRLVPRAEQLGLERPLFYALRFCQRILRTEIPADVMDQAQVGRPGWPTGVIMDFLAQRALRPSQDQGSAWVAGLAAWVLYARSHWLRMPPWLLAQHLTRKTLRRWIGVKS